MLLAGLKARRLGTAGKNRTAAVNFTRVLAGKSAERASRRDAAESMGIGAPRQWRWQRRRRPRGRASSHAPAAALAQLVARAIVPVKVHGVGPLAEKAVAVAKVLRCASLGAAAGYGDAQDAAARAGATRASRGRKGGCTS